MEQDICYLISYVLIWNIFRSKPRREIYDKFILKMWPKAFEFLHIIFGLLYSDLSQLLHVAIPQVHI